ncbi:MAG: sigma-54 interaction domain-containing protein [Burkholderiaceae bacterium]
MTTAANTHDPDLQVLVSYLEHESEPMIVLSPRYEILAANTAYRRQFGTVDKAYIGQKCHKVSHGIDVPCDQAGEQCPMLAAEKRRAPDRVLHIHHTPRGPEHVDVELRPVFDTSGSTTAYVERLSTVRSASAQASGTGLIGQSAQFSQVVASLGRVAPSTLPVLLLGESGTGKELFAHAVHQSSPRSSSPFVVVDCSGLTETLFESELFGYEKGAFTGALTQKPGLVETAAGGTLFLDEIGDVPLSMQIKLLRLIETGTFRRVGSVETRNTDFRLVAATHKPLESMMESGQFRSDLYYRISAFPIRIPPLRDRTEDIPLLVESFLNQPPSGATITVDKLAMAKLKAYAWPGNIRELRNVIDRAKLVTDDVAIRAEDLPEHISSFDRTISEGGSTQPVRPRLESLARPHLADEQALRRFVQSFGGSRTELAKALQISERTLYRRLKAIGM